MVSTSPPEWAVAYARKVKEILGLTHWKVSINCAFVIGGHENCLGLAEVYPLSSEAIISFRADIQESRLWKSVIIHELLHVKHGRIDAAVGEVIGCQLPEGPVRDMADAVYLQAYEPFIDSMSNVLLDLIEGEQLEDSEDDPEDPEI